MKKKLFTLAVTVALLLTCLLAAFPSSAAEKAYTPSVSVSKSVPQYPYDKNAQNYFVDASKGNDSTGDGTINKPFKTIAKAKAVVNAFLQNNSMTRDIVVNLRAGTYYLDNALEFTPTDSGKNGYNVVYRSYDSQQAVVSGGTKLTGWTKVDSSKNIWATSSKGIDSRTLFVNGQRAQRARTGLANLVNDPTSGIMYTNSSNIVSNIQDADGGISVNNTELINYKRQGDMELVFIWNWHAPRVPVKSITNSGGKALITIEEAAYKALRAHRAHSYGTYFELSKSLYFIENAYELLDEPGEWYLNRDNDTVYYIPRSGEDMSNIDAHLGRLEQLVTGIGGKQAQISNLRFDNLAFMHTSWDQGEQPDGWVDIQAGFYSLPPSYTTAVRPSAALAFEYVRNIDFIGCTFAHIGNVALDFSTSTQGVRIASNNVYDISSNGIMLGGHSDTVDYQPRASQMELLCSKNNLIIDNTITRVGAEYFDAVGICRGYAFSTIIAYNTIYDLPYTGMSVGWGWGHGTGDREKTERQFPNGMFSGNAVLCNRIENTSQILADGGAIYTLGRQDGMIVAGNYITRSGEQGIYLDNGSGNITVRDNVLLDVVRNYVVRGHDNTLVNNYTVSAPYADGIQPEYGGVFSIDYANCSDTVRDSVVIAAGSRVAPPTKKLLSNYESVSAVNSVINGAAPSDCRLSYQLVTSGALNGNKSLAFSINSANSKSGQIYFSPLGGVTSFTGYEFLAIRMKNTDTANPVAFEMKVHDNGGPCAELALTGDERAIFMRNANGSNFTVKYKSRTHIIIPAGFDGTVYLPVYDVISAPEFKISLEESGSSYNGKLLWDDPTLYTTAALRTANVYGPLPSPASPLPSAKPSSAPNASAKPTATPAASPKPSGAAPSNAPSVVPTTGTSLAPAPSADVTASVPTTVLPNESLAPSESAASSNKPSNDNSSDIIIIVCAVAAMLAVAAAIVFVVLNLNKKPIKKK